MKVKDLQKILEKYPSDLPVATSGYRGCVDWLYLIEKNDLEIMEEYVIYDGINEKGKKMRCLVIG